MPGGALSLDTVGILNQITFAGGRGLARALSMFRSFCWMLVEPPFSAVTKSIGLARHPGGQIRPHLRSTAVVSMNLTSFFSLRGGALAFQASWFLLCAACAQIL